MEKIKNENDLGLTIGFCNITGLTEKKSNKIIFKKKIQLFDIISFSEIWQTKSSIDKLAHPT